MTAARIALLIGCLSFAGWETVEAIDTARPRAWPWDGKLAGIRADWVLDLHSGRRYAPGNGLRGSAVVFDSLSNPNGDPNGLLNLSFADAALNKLCDPPDPNQAAFFQIFGMSPDGCDPNTFPAPNFPSVGITDNLDITWDDYRMDSSRTGQDPNEIADLHQVSWAAVLPGGETQYVLGFYELFDVNADGCFNEISAFQVQFSRDPNAAPAALLLSVFFDPNHPAQALNTGTVLIDTVDVDPVSGLAKCGSAGAFAGGVTNDPNCPRPGDLISVGSDLSALAGDVWFFANATQGGDPNGPPWDPNHPIDPGGGSCGTDPNLLEYRDIYQGGLLLNIAFVDAQTNRELAHGIPFQFVGEAANEPPFAFAENQTVIDADRDGSETVTLDGSLSDDSDGTIVNYRWTEGQTVLADGPSAAPSVPLAVGTHPIDLEVTDDDGATDTWAITVDVLQPPLADAGADQTVDCTDRVTLDGSASSDLDGTVVNYRWTDGPTVLADGPASSVTVSLPDVGLYPIALEVRDDDGLTDTDVVMIEVVEPTVECEPPPPSSCACAVPVPDPDPCDDEAPFAIGAVVESFDGDPEEILIEDPNGAFVDIELDRCYPAGTKFYTGQAELTLKICGTYRGRAIEPFVITVRHTSEVIIDRLLIEPASESVVTRMRLATGAVRTKIDDCRADYSTDTKVSTPNATAGVRGTDFLQSTGCLPYDSIALIDDGLVDVLLDPNDPNTPYQIGRNQRARVYGDGTVVIETTPELVIASPEIDFGDVLVGETLTLRPLIGNSTSSSMTVHSYAVDGVPDARPSFDIPPEEIDSIAVSFTPTATGPYSGTLEIFYDLSVLVVPLHGNGTATPMPNCNIPAGFCVPGCGGADLTRDCTVDLSDLAVVLGEFGCSGSGCSGDTDDDGDTDLSDLAEVLARFGVACP